MFDNVDQGTGWIGAGGDRQPLADKMSSAWAAFAHTGNPSHARMPQWPANEIGSRATMIFNRECVVVNDPGKEEPLWMSSLSRG